MQPIIGTEKLSLEHKTLLTPDLEAPLVYLVHGRAGNYDVMWTFKRAITANCNFIAPQAFIPEKVVENNAEGHSWWQYNEAENNLDKVCFAAEKLSAFMNQAEDAYNLNPQKRIAFGFSQGAALLSLLIQQKPEMYDAVALLAGFVVESRQPVNGRLPGVFMAHGTKDQIINIDLSKQGFDYLKNQGFDVRYFSEETGHKVGLSTMRELTSWISEKL